MTAAGARIVAVMPSVSVEALLIPLEDALAALPEVAALASTASGDAVRLTLTLEPGAAPDAAMACLRALAPGARVQVQRPTRFGDSPELSAWLLGLIREGSKTATCGAVRDYEADGEPLPVPGDVMLATEWNGTPALVYEVTEVTVLPFAAVPEAFALAEGEGDFAAWREGHRAFFGRNGGFDPAMPVVCERFVLIEDLAPPREGG